MAAGVPVVAGAGRIAPRGARATPRCSSTRSTTTRSRARSRRLLDEPEDPRRARRAWPRAGRPLHVEHRPPSASPSSIVRSHEGRAARRPAVPARARRHRPVRRRPARARSPTSGSSSSTFAAGTAAARSRRRCCPATSISAARTRPGATSSGTASAGPRCRCDADVMHAPSLARAPVARHARSSSPSTTSRSSATPRCSPAAASSSTGAVWRSRTARPRR